MEMILIHSSRITYVGGTSSVRGYKAASIGKQYYDESQDDFVSTGGTTKIVASTSMLFPTSWRNV
jgi:outer membrane protein assembly factor BamA